MSVLINSENTPMPWQPITLSGKHRKAMDRLGGAELILPWPPGLPDGTRGAKLIEDEERDATPAEHAAAEQIVGAACRAEGLVPVRVSAAMLRRPETSHSGAGYVPHSGQVELHLVVLIIGRRWVNASTRRQPPQFWYIGEITAV